MPQGIGSSVLHLTRLRRKVSAQVYEPVIDPNSLNPEDSELTPIFHALATHAADPVEHFHRDPLDAPLPASVPAQPAMARMLLRSVPTMRPDSGAPVPSTVPATSGQPNIPCPASRRSGHHELRGITELRGARGGRHRAPGPVGRGPYAR